MRIFDKNELLKDFIKKAKAKHGDRYSYDFVEYKDNKTKVKIICKKHGEFWQQPNHHLSGRNCIKCGRDVCSKILSKTLNSSQILFLKNNIDKLTMSQLEKELGVCDTVIRKEMIKHKIKLKSHDYGPIYKDIPRYLWYNLNRGAQERNLIVEISPKDIWNIYIKQNKVCALSGVEIVFGKIKQGNTTASVDRINSKIGYIKTNIQIVHKTINKMKQNLSQDDFIYFCKCVNNTSRNNK